MENKNNIFYNRSNNFRIKTFINLIILILVSIFISITMIKIIFKFKSFLFDYIFSSMYIFLVAISIVIPFIVIIFFILINKSIINEVVFIKDFIIVKKNKGKECDVLNINNIFQMNLIYNKRNNEINNIYLTNKEKHVYLIEEYTQLENLKEEILKRNKNITVILNKKLKPDYKI
jgi:hypothetical protein